MKFTASVLAFAASASAHMQMEYPKPFVLPDKAPLDPSGSNFPCQATGPEYYASSAVKNQWNAGETQQVKFVQNTAVHGGGSCQFSITTDKAPSKESQWKVLHTVIGGCPSNARGNLGDYPEDGEDDQKVNSYPVTLPSDLPPGEYTFAWTWFNKIGNREMYMNCAPIQVGGGANTASTQEVSAVLGSKPDMFVANLPPEQCSTTEGDDLDFPNPGESVEHGPKAKIALNLKGSGCAAMTGLGAGNGNLGSPSQPTGSPSQPSGYPEEEAPAPTQPASTAAPSPIPSNPGGIFAPGASSAAPAPSEPASPTSSAAPVQSAAPTGAPVYSPPENNSPPENTTPPKTETPKTPTTGAPASGQGVPCDKDGAIVCIGSNQFGVCNWGVAFPQALASGTTCSGGVISKRSMRFPRAYLHRRHGSGLL